MRVDNSTGKGTSGMDKFSSKVHSVHMELGGKLLNSSMYALQCTQILIHYMHKHIHNANTHAQHRGTYDLCRCAGVHACCGSELPFCAPLCLP